MKKIIVVCISLLLLTLMVFPASANTVFVEQYNSTFDYAGSTSVMFPMYYYLADYNYDSSEFDINFRFQTIYDYFIRLRGVGYYSMSIEYSTGPTITINGRQDNQSDATFLFMPLSFSLDSLWSRPIELGDVLNYLTITLRSQLASNFPVYVDVGIANSNFDGYNLTDEFYQSIVWAGEQLFSSTSDYTYTLEGTFSDAYWIVFKLSTDFNETVSHDHMYNLIEFKNLSCTFTHYEDKLDDVLVGIDGVNNTLNSGFSDINRGQLEIKDGLDDVNTSIGNLNSSIQDTNDKLDQMLTPIDPPASVGDIQLYEQEFQDFYNSRVSELKGQVDGIFIESSSIMTDLVNGFAFWGVMFTEYMNSVPVFSDSIYLYSGFCVISLLFGGAAVSLGTACYNSYLSARRRVSNRESESSIDWNAFFDAAVRRAQRRRSN